MATKKGSKKSAKTGSTKKGKSKKDKKGKNDKKSKTSRATEKSSRSKLESRDSPASKKITPWSHEAQIQYRLSDKKWVEKGWTTLPREMIIHKFLTYKTIPSKPHMLMFKKRLKPLNLCYSSGKPLAQFKKNGMGTIYYPDGKVAVIRQRGRKCNRFIIFNPSKLQSSLQKLIEHARGISEVRVPERDIREGRGASKSRIEVRPHSKRRGEARSPSKGRKEVGASSTRTSPHRTHSKAQGIKRKPSPSPNRLRGSAIGAMFDSWGNGVIYDEAGNVRLNFTQREGILLDGPSGLPVRWKWPVKYTKGDSVENLGTHEQKDIGEKEVEEKDSDDEEEKQPENLEVTEQTDKKSKGRSSKGKMTEKKKSGKNLAESKSSKNSSKKNKKTESGSKSSQKSSKKGKKQKSGGSNDTDTTDTPKSGKQKKRKSAAGGDEEKSRKEPDGTEVWPDIPEETSDQHDVSTKVTDGRGDEPVKVPSAPEIGRDNFKQQLAEINALRNKYFLPGIAPLKPITIKVNDYFSFRVFDQSNMSLVFYAQHKMIRMELGYVVDPTEIIKVNKIDPVKWYEDKGVPCQIELFAKRSMNKYKNILNHQREKAEKKLIERRQNEKRFGGPYL